MNDAAEHVRVALAPPAERGATRIADRVVAKLAAQAAREALEPGARTATRRPSTAGRPEATASVQRHPGADGSTGLARVSVAVELVYPSDIGAQCRAVRSRVTRRIGELAGMETTEVAVDVRGLRSDHLASDGRLA